MDCSKIYALKNMRGANKKKEFIRNNAEDVDFKLFLYYALNPMLSYNLSEKTLSDLYGCEDTPKPFLDILCCFVMKSLEIFAMQSSAILAGHGMKLLIRFLCEIAMLIFAYSSQKRIG